MIKRYSAPARKGVSTAAHALSMTAWCDDCDAAVGARCMTSSGVVAQWPHQSRMRRARRLTQWHAEQGGKNTMNGKERSEAGEDKHRNTNEGQSDPSEVPSAEADSGAGDAHQNDTQQDQNKGQHLRAVPGAGHVQAVGRRIVQSGGAWTVES